MGPRPTRVSRSRGARQPQKRALVLDASAIIAATQANPKPRMIALLKQAHQANSPIFVCSVTLAEVLRGAHSDAPTHRLLRSATVVPVDAKLGQRAGERIGRKALKGNITIDALVAETAESLDRAAAIVTSDGRDFRALVDAPITVAQV